MLIALFIGVFLCVSAAFLKPNLLFVLLSFVAFGFYFNLPEPNYLFYLIFVFSVAFLIVEFYIPGFGIFGLMGISGGFSSLYLSGLYFIDTLALGLILFAFSFMVFSIYLKLGFKLNLSPGLILHTDQGETLAQKEIEPLLNQKGITKTPLRPVGKIDLDGKVYEAYSDEEMIASNQMIVVSKIENNKIYVRRSEEL